MYGRLTESCTFCYLLVGILENCNYDAYRTSRMYNCTRYLMQIGKTLQTRLWYRQFQGERNVIHINDAQVERSMRESSQKTQMSNPRVTQAPSEPAMLSRNSLLFEARTKTISFVKSSFHKLARQSLKKQVHKLHPERKKVTGRNNIQVKGKI
jgi:hypothetical protein